MTHNADRLRFLIQERKWELSQLKDLVDLAPKLLAELDHYEKISQEMKRVIYNRVFHAELDVRKVVSFETAEFIYDPM